MWLFWILVLLLVIGLVVWVARQAGARGGTGAGGTASGTGTTATPGSAQGVGPLPPSGDSAEEVLRQRYARGEIDREEYQQRLRDLREG